MSPERCPCAGVPTFTCGRCGAPGIVPARPAAVDLDDAIEALHEGDDGDALIEHLEEG